MRVADLRRTSAFRHTVVLLAFLGMALAGAFTLMSMWTSDFLVKRVDSWLFYERDQLRATGQADLPRLVAWNARFEARRRRELVLYDHDGKRLAGNDLALPAGRHAEGVPFQFRALTAGRVSDHRGILVAWPGDETLLISERLGWVALFDRSLLQLALIAGAVVAAIGLGAAALMGINASRQIGAMSLSMQAIMSGDLSRRLPRGRRPNDIDRMAGVVNDMLAEIERLVREVESVTHAIAHDLRTPLTRLLAVIERTERRAREVEEYAAGLDEAAVEVRHLLEIFAAMLRLAELEAGKRRTGFGELGLEEIAESVVDFLEPVAEQKDISIRAVGPPAPFTGDRRLLFEALSNIVDNAIKYTPAGGGVTVEVMDGDAPGFVVTDTGPGIPAHERVAVLRRFYRIESSRHLPGNGLGLSMVVAIASLHDMVVRIEDANPEPGARISIRAAV